MTTAKSGEKAARRYLTVASGGMYARARTNAASFIRFLSVKRGGLYVDWSHDYTDSILVAGSGRSGTTLVAEIINARHIFRDIFEPFNPARVDICSHFASRQYLRSTDDDPLYLDPARRIVSGRIRSDWTDANNRRIVCRRRLIKDIRVNLLLKWLLHHFPELPTVYVLRHPCAVAASRLQQQWDAPLEELLQQRLLVADYLEPFMDNINGSKSLFERHLLLWCIENYVPMKLLRRGEVLVMFYEDLCAHPAREVARLAAYLKLEDQVELMLRRVPMPSKTSKQRSTVAGLEDPLYSWRTRLSPEMIRLAVKMLELFRLHRIYGPDALPLEKAENVLPE